MTSSDQRPGSANEGAKHYRILYIDDAPQVRKAFVFLYETMGHEIDVAEDGPSGLQKVEQGEYDIVISDFTMPSMNGREVAAAVKAVRANTVVVLVTGWPLSQVPEVTAGEVVEDYLFEKPFTVAHLNEVIGGIER